MVCLLRPIRVHQKTNRSFDRQCDVFLCTRYNVSVLHCCLYILTLPNIAFTSSSSILPS